MSGFIASIMEILTYKPTNKTSFELLESDSEGMERENTPEASNVKPDAPRPKDRMQKSHGNNSSSGTSAGPTISGDIAVNKELVEKEFGIPYNMDVSIRQFKLARKLDSFIVYFDGMVDKTYISDFLLRPLLDPSNFKEYFNESNEDDASISKYISDNIISAHQISESSDYKEIFLKILSGDTALFADGCDKALIISTKGYEKRNIEKPVTENVIMGSQEGFTETLRTNISLVRKSIKNRNLITELIEINSTNHSIVGIMYINGIVDQEVVKEVKRRLSSIDTSFILDGSMAVQFIEDNPYMLFPQILTTERPDRTASFLLEGKVAILSDGAPFAHIAPATFFHLLQTSEDSMIRWQYGTFLRMIRMLGLFLATMLPGLYLAITLFHQEMIPTELLASIARSKEQVPFPSVLEVLMLELSFELIREGGIRVPGVIGQTLGIIGALILGQAAVAAGLVSPVLIIIVSVTGLGSFAIPNYNFAIGVRIIRFLFIFMAAVAGFYGISLAIFIVSCLACSMKSFGVPFLSPMAPKTKDNPDLILRKPIWMQKERPDYLNTPNRKKQSNTSGVWNRRETGGRQNEGR